MAESRDLPTAAPAAPVADRARVLVGLDGSAESLAALRWALDDAQFRQADVEIIACWYPPLLADSTGYGLISPDELAADVQRQLDAALASVSAEVDRARSQGRSITGRLLDGEPGPILVGESKGAAVLVVGRGRGGLARVLLGSVSRHVVSHAECPVVVVPAGV